MQCTTRHHTFITFSNMANFKCYLFMFLLHLIFLNGTSQTHQIINRTRNKNRLYVFGDSLFDVGNLRFTSEGKDIPSFRYPYGFTYFTNATGRFCDGRVVPEFIAELANLGRLSASMDPEGDFTNGADFACGGAQATSDNSEGTFNLVDQLQNFTEMVATMKAAYGDVEAKEILGNAIYLFSIGNNDYVTFYEGYYDNGTLPTCLEQEAFVEAVIGNITSALMEIYSAGGRKFAFQNVGPLGCLPIMQPFHGYDGQCITLLLELAEMHNSLLLESLNGMAQNLTGFKYSIFDYYNNLLDRIRNPTAYGFQSGTVACCGYIDDPYRSDGCGNGNFIVCPYPSAYLFFDGAHTTQHTNIQLAKLIWNASQPESWPYNVRQLFEEVLIREDNKYII